MSDDVRQQLLADIRADILKRQLSNTENFDRAILTLSSAVLALSLTFIKNIVAIESAICTSVLTTSWALMVAAIVITLISFHLSQWGLRIQLERAERYYLHGDHECLKESNRPAAYTDVAAYISSAAFVAGIICLVVFVTANITNEREPMADQSKSQDVQKGANIPSIQSAPPTERVNNGANVPSIQQLPPAQPATPPAQQGGDTTKK